MCLQKSKWGNRAGPLTPRYHYVLSINAGVSDEDLPQLQPEKERRQDRSLSTESRTGTAKTMLQSRVLVIALILLLSTTLPEVHSKSIFERDRRDWLVIPDAVASYVYEAVNKVSPRVGQFLVDAAQTPAVVATRNFLIRETTKLSIMAEQLIEKIKNLWSRVRGY